MPLFLVDAFHPDSRGHELLAVAQRVCAAAERMTCGGTAVRYVRSHFIGNDETSLHLLEAPSEASAGEACRLAGIDVDRVVEIAEITGSAGDR